MGIQSFTGSNLISCRKKPEERYKSGRALHTFASAKQVMPF